MSTTPVQRRRPVRALRRTPVLTMIPVLGLLAVTVLAGQPLDDRGDAVQTLVSRLDLEHYKATIKGLTQFGDRRQGTTRNRDAVDWIEAQLQAAGCTSTERVVYTFEPEPRRPGEGAVPAGGTRPPLNPTEPTPTGGAVGRNGSGPGGLSGDGRSAHDQHRLDAVHERHPVNQSS